MSSPKTFVIPPETLNAQSRAANPQDSVWVSANAGSGKTHVLTERVIRLLLEGTEPSKILCLTYTKAAAAVMQNRVFARLSGWAALSDEELARTLFLLEGREPGHRRLAQARRLFARALETPGGLKIQTIHAFCEAILHQFPLEANIAGHFELMDDLMQSALVGEARRQVLETARTGSKPLIAKAFADVLSASGEAGLQSLFDEAVARRQDILQFNRDVASAEERRSVFFHLFDLTGDETETEIEKQLWPLQSLPVAYLRELFDLAGSLKLKTAASFAENLLAVAEQADSGALQSVKSQLIEVFLRQDGLPRSFSNVAAAKIVAVLPDIEERVNAALSQIVSVIETLRQIRLVELNLSAFALIDDLLSRYQKMKRDRGLLDFDDLIARTASLLSREDVGPWVQYKLDRGIDHILVDEAQDTSPGQWSVIRSLSEEFFSGVGARELRRTLFAVGDEKQSIYSFQGALPEEFAGVGEATRRKAAGADLSFEKVSLNFSFRSTRDVLSAVDRVFARPEAFKGLGGQTLHDAIRDADPGEVEIWDVLAPETVEEGDDWRQPVDQLPAPAVRLAELIAQTIRHWLKSGAAIPGQRRRIEARDIMVLVRKRDKFMPALSRALKTLKIPVAGADRLRLTDHIAVKDLMAIGRFVLQPADDLSLAALLKSPLFSWGDDRLFEVAYPRRAHETLYSKLRRLAEGDEAIAAVVATLQHWRSHADQVTVFEFYADILGRGGARRRLLARLGHEASDVIDEFQNYAIAIARSGLPGLQAFLETLDATAPEIKRELDQNRDEVRIMTVHAAKGLEAPIVFLIDPGAAAWSGSKAPRLLPFAAPTSHGESKGLLWVPSKDHTTEFTRNLIDRLKIRAEEEYRRLLYVGMTRAEDRLIVCGYRGATVFPDTWHGLVSAGLAEEIDVIDHPVKGVQARRYRVSLETEVNLIEKPEAEAVPIEPFPAAYLKPLPREPGLPRPLSPSGASALIEVEDEQPLSTGSPVFDSADSSSPAFAIRRGTVIHALLQRLPDVEDSEREALARQYLERTAADWPQRERHNAIASVFSVLRDPTFAPVFAPGSKAELSVMGTLRLGEKDYAVSGKIDRLAVSEDRVVIVDYKTNRPPPAGLADVPPTYIAQLALYRALLQPLYPDREIAAALLFTEAPALIEIPQIDMEMALAKLGL